MASSDGLPWGWSRVTTRLPLAPAAYSTATLDPVTQTGRFRDASGHQVDMGRHGTNKTIGTTSRSGGGKGGDGGNGPQPEVNDDNTVDYAPD